MSPEQKWEIIRDARKAVRRGLPESANPHSPDSEAHAVWSNFYRMTLTDALRNDLIDSEYEASAY